MEETNYQNNKDIKVRKRGRPKKVQPTPTPVVELTEQEQLEEWVKNNRVWFFNYGKKERKDLEKVYRLYNILFNTNRRVGSCGGCHLNIIRTIKEKYYG